MKKILFYFTYINLDGIHAMTVGSNSFFTSCVFNIVFYLEDENTSKEDVSTYARRMVIYCNMPCLFRVRYLCRSSSRRLPSFNTKRRPEGVYFSIRIGSKFQDPLVFQALLQTFLVQGENLYETEFVVSHDLQRAFLFPRSDYLDIQNARDKKL